jgi:hypothetical protein
MANSRIVLDPSPYANPSSPHRLPHQHIRPQPKYSAKQPRPEYSPQHSAQAQHNPGPRRRAASITPVGADKGGLARAMHEIKERISAQRRAEYLPARDRRHPSPVTMMRSWAGSHPLRSISPKRYTREMFGID